MFAPSSLITPVPALTSPVLVTPEGVPKYPVTSRSIPFDAPGLTVKTVLPVSLSATSLALIIEVAVVPPAVTP